ncbi:complex I intermediate-associated protein 30-domain-containing protein [Zopfochytrium polystomum]|nr:complex I intermediate-associated protein 30-domain-containing protein [Zopfochytrium polystomum]
MAHTTALSPSATRLGKAPFAHAGAIAAAAFFFAVLAVTAAAVAAAPGPAAPTQGDRLFLFGGDCPWNVSRWFAVDDRVRGGASVSTLTAVDGGVAAVFQGTLNTTALGGAGFASQRSLAEAGRPWNLTGYSGIEIVVLDADDRTYAFNLMNAVGQTFPNGTVQSSVEYKYSFNKTTAAFAPSASGFAVHRAPFSAFPATARGRVVPGAAPLDVAAIAAVSVMIESYFGAQASGGFALTVAAVAAYREEEE